MNMETENLPDRIVWQDGPVRLQHSQGIAIVTTDDPPVNALSHAVRKGLAECLSQAVADASIRAVVLACAGKTFFAGADIAELGKPPQKPTLRNVVDIIAGASKPVIAAIHGSALGGGLELALACRLRIANTPAKLGLPEVKLGMIPGSGGTVRATYLLGPVVALDLISSGRSIDATTALKLGLVDHVTDGDLIGRAVEVANENHGPASISHIPARRQIQASDLEAFERAAVEAIGKSRSQEGPKACVQAIRNAIHMSFDGAMAEERKLFEDLVASPQASARRHLFFAERSAAKVPGLPSSVTPREISKVGIVGAGTMGAGIAMSFLNAGLPVTIVDVSTDVLQRGLASIKRIYETSVKRGSISEREKDDRLESLSSTGAIADLADADLVVEAVFEDMEVKKGVFKELDNVLAQGAILATNTSYLDVNEIARATRRPQDVIGLHFFSPANVMRLLEIVRGSATAEDVLATALVIAKKLSKAPVVVGVGHGFVGNRMLEARSADSQSLLLEGAYPEQIDKVFVEFGWPMGPFQMGDLAGLDIGWRNRKSLHQFAPVADALCELGRFGQKTGKGYYLYPEGSRSPANDPDVMALIERLAADAGLKRRSITTEEIIERTHFPMINEGYKLLAEGIATRLSDIDVVWTAGYGFPADKGGPMFWAARLGTTSIASRLRYWHEKTSKDAFRITDAFGTGSIN